MVQVGGVIERLQLGGIQLVAVINGSQLGRLAD
jgi:hypothetical protein